MTLTVTGELKGARKRPYLNKTGAKCLEKVAKIAAYFFQCARDMPTPEHSMSKHGNHADTLAMAHCSSRLRPYVFDKGMPKTYRASSPLIYCQITPKERGPGRVLSNIRTGSMKHQMWAASVGGKCAKCVICVTKNSPFWNIFNQTVCWNVPWGTEQAVWAGLGPALLLLGNVQPDVCGQPGLRSLGQGAHLHGEDTKRFMETPGRSRPEQPESSACSTPQGMDGWMGCYLPYLHREQLCQQKPALLALFRAVIFRPSWFQAPLASRIPC